MKTLGQSFWHVAKSLLLFLNLDLVENFDEVMDQVQFYLINKFFSLIKCN